MAKYTRGEFLGFGAALAGAFTLGRRPAVAQTAPQAPATSSAGVEPDVIVVNGLVYTSDSALARAEAFAMKNGRFTAVGSSSDIPNLPTPATHGIDVQRMTSTPRFT